MRKKIYDFSRNETFFSYHETIIYISYSIFAVEKNNKGEMTEN